MRLQAVLIVMLAACSSGCAKPSEPTPATTGPVSGTEQAATPSPDPTPVTSSPAPVPVSADTDADVNKAIDENLGDHIAYRKVFDQLKAAVSAGDKQGVADLVSFPLGATIDGKSKQISESAEFVAHYDKIVTPAIAQVINQQKFSDVMASYRGVMLGQGEVWINGLCKDNECKAVDVRVVTIQPKSDLSP